jgi:undecaprenyl diphosphate synthase
MFNSPVPRHVAVIMDGNGRWANQRDWPRVRGHQAGAESVRRIVRACGQRGVDVLTLYSFSTENWQRPEFEVEALMSLLATYLDDERAELMENNVRLRGIGELHRLPEHVQTLLAAATEVTAGNSGLLLQLALSYGGRAELVQAVQSIAQDVQAGVLAADRIDEEAISSRLYTAGLPDPDLLIRTSGEMRLSNFLPWQLAYAEIYVTDVLWPDFDVEHLDEALSSYARRRRRFGMTDAQLEGEQ